MKFNYLTSLLAAITLNTLTLNASWAPDCLSGYEDLPLKTLSEEKWIELKQQVLHYLHNSWCTQEKADLLMELIALTRPNVCVEIGAFTGSSVLPVAATLRYLKHGKLYAVDAWSNQEAIKGLDENDINSQWWRTVNMKEIKGQFEGLIHNWQLEPHCSIIHLPSEEAVARFEPIDFLHLDGNFSEEGALMDALLYIPKVKSGGYILLSNLFIVISNYHTKMKSLWALLDSCEIVCEIENSNAVLFKKN